MVSSQGPTWSPAASRRCATILAVSRQPEEGSVEKARTSWSVHRASLRRVLAVCAAAGALVLASSAIALADGLVEPPPPWVELSVTFGTIAGRIALVGLGVIALALTSIGFLVLARLARSKDFTQGPSAATDPTRAEKEA